MSQREERRKITINVYSTLATTVQHINPLNKIRAEAHVTKSATQERPVHPVEGLLLIKREDCKRDVRGRGIVDHITEEGLYIYLPGTPQLWSGTTTAWMT